MNERIKLLAEQVDKEFDNPGARHKAIERFALLIVNDCLDIVDKEVSGMVGVHAMRKIEEHFGVDK